MRLDVWHLLSTGHVSFMRQLQLSVVFSVLLSLVSIVFLWFDIITSLAKEVMFLVALVCLFNCLSVCLFVDITQTFMNGLG